jgi:hypothetical protein
MRCGYLVSKWLDSRENGSCLFELILVIVIMGILASTGVRMYIGFVRTAEERVCNNNRKQVERMYVLFLIMESEVHSEDLFNAYLQEYGELTCPAGGEFTYGGGIAQCSRHPSNTSEDSHDSFHSEETCRGNRLALEASYHQQLARESLQHSDTLFVQHMERRGIKVCPANGVVKYSVGKVLCSVHSEQGGSVPIL